MVLDSLEWRLHGWHGVTTPEGSNVKLVVDTSIPTDHGLTEMRPHLIVYFRGTRQIVTVEIACILEHLGTRGRKAS